VYKKPLVAIFSTGNEIVDIQCPNSFSQDGWGGIWDTNRPSLQAALRGLVYRVADLGIVPDELVDFTFIPPSTLTSFETGQRNGSYHRNQERFGIG
jgi:molybdopterin biosynthesis enzyme